MKKIVDKLGAYAQSKHKDISIVFEEMLDFFIETFDLERILKHKCDYSTLFAERKKENETLFELMIAWLKLSVTEIEKEGAYDFFGLVYEEVVKGKFKSAAMGQFFTPMPLCKAMADVIPSEGEIVEDSACGSGRTLLAHHAHCDRTKFYWYKAADLDPVSVKMCALNMMVNGMIGEVKHGDSITGEVFEVYKVNEIKYPLPNPACCIRRYKPTKQTQEEEKVENPVEVIKEYKATQMSLFE